MTIQSIFVLVMSLLVGQTSPPPAHLPTSLDMAVVRALPVQHDGRWPPLDTVARDLVESITGDPEFEGQDPVLLLLAWTFDPQGWGRKPLIKIANAELRGELKLPPDRTRFSYDELTRQRYLHTLVDALANIEGGRKLNPLEAKVKDIQEKLVTLQRIFAGVSIRPIPNAEDIGGSWRPVRPPKMGSAAVDEQVWSAWSALKTAFLADDATGFNAAAQSLGAALRSLPSAHRVDPAAIATELKYNRVKPFTTAWIMTAIGAALSIVALIVRRKWFDMIVLLSLAAAFAVMTWGLALRWQIAGRIPASNMFESLLFLGWGMVLFAIIAIPAFRHRLVPMTASVMAAISLFIADVLPLDSYVRPIPPVLLDTVWMSIHVPVIMVSYSVLAIGVFVAHVQIVAMAAAPRNHRLSEKLDSLHYWYIQIGSILLAAGIITGSMWAASSWGRYWGWDPKEVWSLVALIGYLTILHVRINKQPASRWTYVMAGVLGAAMLAAILPKFMNFAGDSALMSAGKVFAFLMTLGAMAFLLFTTGRFATAAKSILCFWLIIMTYVGVNYVLGIGLHSYGFGSGAVVRYMFGLGGLDLLVVLLIAGVYLAGARNA